MLCGDNFVCTAVFFGEREEALHGLFDGFS